MAIRGISAVSMGHPGIVAGSLDGIFSAFDEVAYVAAMTKNQHNAHHNENAEIGLS